MLRALAQLGVIHKPDFDDPETADLFDQMSRSENSVKVLEEQGGSLVMALMSDQAHEGVTPDLMHQVRNGDREQGREILLKVMQIKTRGDDEAQAPSDR